MDKDIIKPTDDNVKAELLVFLDNVLLGVKGDVIAVNEELKKDELFFYFYQEGEWFFTLTLQYIGRNTLFNLNIADENIIVSEQDIDLSSALFSLLEACKDECDFDINDIKKYAPDNEKTWLWLKNYNSDFKVKGLARIKQMEEWRKGLKK